jgi:hypothetical protein
MDSALLLYFYGYSFETKLITRPHLEVEISKAGWPSLEQRLSYQTAWHDPRDAGYTEVPIVGARVLTK